MKINSQILAEHLEASHKALIQEAVIYESLMLLEVISPKDLEALSKASMALNKISAPFANKLPLLRAMAIHVNSLFLQIDDAEDEVRAAELTGHAIALLTQLDDAMDYVNNKLMDIFANKLPVGSNPTTPLANLMSAKQAVSVSNKIAEQLFKTDLFSKLPFLKGKLAKEGFTKSQAKALAVSLLNLSYDELQKFIVDAAKASNMVADVKNKIQDIESISTSKLGAAWNFVKNMGSGSSGGSIGGMRG